MPDRLILDGTGVSKRRAKHVCEKVALQLSFMKLGEASAGFEICPANKYGMGAIDSSIIKTQIFGRLL
jgi:hypothetical protein